VRRKGMDSPKHTPGPFRVSGPSHDDLDPSKCGDYAIVDEQNHIVAECYRLVAVTTELPAEANARLFAAAPTMYEALKWMLDYSRDSRPAMAQEAFARAREAIALAEGNKDAPK
jgi:hypothetical protein